MNLYKMFKIPNRVYTSDVNDAEPRLFIIDTEPRLSFSEKNGRDDTLAKRARSELRLYVTETETALFENHLYH